jgi:hypothetical protein
MLELLALGLSLAKPPHLMMPALPAPARASFQSGERAVDNWRMQAALDLDLGPEAALRLLAGKAPANLPRCIRLNNYWCIKKAGWAGELGADQEEHVAFASADEGAAAAITLLRRYYLDYGRKSARAIVARWAPAQCGVPLLAGGAVQPSVQRSSPATSLAPLARRGIGNTLRARWLAAHGRGGVALRRAARKVAIRRSVVPDTLAPEPPITLEPPLKTEPLRVASLSPPASSPPASTNPFLAPARPTADCASEGARIASYAARAIEGIAQSPDDDLQLFAANGTPLPALPRLLANMASVEIGPYRADPKLIDAAIEAVQNIRR